MILLVSKQVAAQLPRESGVSGALDAKVVSGLQVTESDLLPMQSKTGRVIQRDRFATYEPADMDWAEPAGLAAWETETVHALLLDDSCCSVTMFHLRPTAGPFVGLDLVDSIKSNPVGFGRFAPW